MSFGTPPVADPLGDRLIAPDRPSPYLPDAPVGRIAFLGVAVASLGGPLALAALYAPTIVADSGASAGLIQIAGAVVFAVPLVIWLRYSRHVQSAGGLYAFVEAAAGRRTALVQAVLWIVSYLLYLLYTTASIVYDVLPAVSPAVRPYRALLEIAIPVSIAVVMLAGRSVALAVIGSLALAQLVLVGVLAAVSIGHDAPMSSFGIGAPGATLTTGTVTATAQVSLLYVCGSLPLFLGGEVVRPRSTIRRGMAGASLLVAAVVTAAVFPFAANPAFLSAPIPGMSVAQVFAGHGLALAIGVGVAASIAGVMLVEYLALSRLLHVVTGQPPGAVIAAIGVALVATAPITLLGPDEFYDALLRPSLVALWLSQLIVFAVYPRFASRLGWRRLWSVALAFGGSAFAMYGVYATVQHAST